MSKKIFLLGALASVFLFFGFADSASACGGLFCQNNPVDQAAERIVFSVNPDGTVTSLIEIAYTEIGRAHV